MTVETPARIAYDRCPLCGSPEWVEHALGDCAHHPLYKPTLPSAMRWLRCKPCQHVFIDGYWSDWALATIFSSENPHQMPGANLHRSREVAARMVERVLHHRASAKGLWVDVGF